MNVTSHRPVPLQVRSAGYERLRGLLVVANIGHLVRAAMRRELVVDDRTIERPVSGTWRPASGRMAGSAPLWPVERTWCRRDLCAAFTARGCVRSVVCAPPGSWEVQVVAIAGLHSQFGVRTGDENVDFKIGSLSKS